MVIQEVNKSIWYTNTIVRVNDMEKNTDARINSKIHINTEPEKSPIPEWAVHSSWQQLKGAKQL